MLSENAKEKLDDIVFYIINSIEYKKCVDIKKKMSENKELIEEIESIKKLQKEFIKSNDIKIKEQLDNKINYLNTIPIYVEYNNNLEKVNDMIDLVKEKLNDYFYDKLNKIDF